MEDHERGPETINVVNGVAKIGIADAPNDQTWIPALCCPNISALCSWRFGFNHGSTWVRLNMSNVWSVMKNITDVVNGVAKVGITDAPND